MQVKNTQRSIKRVLTERYYSWKEAEELAKNDPEINLNGGRLYTPFDFMDEDLAARETALESDAKLQQNMAIESEMKAGQRLSTNI